MVSLQEEELDELAGQVQVLESARLRLEMAMEQIDEEREPQRTSSER